MRYPASLQTCHGSNPLRAKSGPSQAADMNLATGVSGNLLGERYPSCQGASAIRRRVVASWTTGGSCMVPPDGHRRSQSLNRERHPRTNGEGTQSAGYCARTQRINVGMTLAQATRAGCCEHPAPLSTPLTRGEKSLTNANLSRPLRLFNGFCIYARLRATRERLIHPPIKAPCSIARGKGQDHNKFLRSRFGYAPEATISADAAIISDLR